MSVGVYFKHTTRIVRTFTNFYLFVYWKPTPMCERLLIVVCLFQTHAQGAKFYLLLFISKPRTMRELLLIGVSLFIELERVPRSGQNE